MQREFYSGYGTSLRTPFIAWSETHVYFPIVYDGAEWIERVPKKDGRYQHIHLGRHIHRLHLGHTANIYI